MRIPGLFKQFGVARASLRSPVLALPGRIGSSAITAALTNARLAKTGTYTVLNSDKRKTVALGGSAFYTLTVNAASGYDADFQIMVVNEDTGRGKTIAISGITNFILYPGQSFILFNQNNTWRTIGPGRWKQGGTVNLFCDFTNGDNLNDGLAAGTGNAKKTLQSAFDAIINDFDFKGTSSGPTRAVINMAASTTDTTGIHIAGHAFVGAQGGAAVKILGGSGAKVTTTGTDALAFDCNTQVQIQGVELSTVTSGDCIHCELGAQVYILSSVTFGACAGSHMSVNTGGRIYRNANYTVSGNATTAHMLGQGSAGAITGSGLTITVSANITVGFWALMSNASCLVATTETYSLGAFTVTGKRYEADNLALISTNGGGANYFPGTVAGTTSGGGQYV
jgi:hypothetical protein